MLKTILNRYLILIITLLILLNFYLAPKSTVAYNTSNLRKKASVVRIEKVNTITKR